MKSETFILGLLVYVVVCIFLGFVDYYIPFMSDNAIINLAVFLGIGTIIVLALRNNAYEK